MRLCHTADKRAGWRDVEGALIDLAVATTAVRRAHRLRSSGCQFEHVFHYTSRKTFFDIFPEATEVERPPRLLLSPTELLNDPNEGVHFFDTLANSSDLSSDQLIEGLMRHRLHMRADFGLSANDPLVFVASLCLEQDNLNLWRFYGGAQGVSFGVHQAQFDLTSEEGLSDDYRGPDKLYRVKYGDIEVRRALSHVMPALGELDGLYVKRQAFQEHIIKSVNGLLSTIAYLFKNPSYESERECRLLRVQSVDDVRGGDSAQTIGGIVKSKSNTRFLHEAPGRPLVILGPQFDTINPERGQTKAIDRMRVSMPDHRPIVRLSNQKFRAPDEELLAAKA